MIKLSDALGERDGTAEIPFVSSSSWERMGEQLITELCVLHHAQLISAEMLSLHRLVLVLPSTLGPT